MALQSNPLFAQIDNKQFFLADPSNEENEDTSTELAVPQKDEKSTLKKQNKII